jgi:phosphatidylserine decarboxylase
MSGAIVYQRHEMGEHLNVLLKEASQYNESNWIGIQKGNRKALVRQMAGAIARRIVSDVNAGETVSRGEKLGVICYGSTVELFIPKKSFNPSVKVGKRVKTGKTVLGEWSE